MSSPYDILSDIQSHGGLGRAYVEKQIHQVPKAEVVDRVKFLEQRCAGRTVLDIGYASGELHSKLKTVAKAIYGLDKNGTDVGNYRSLDLDRVDSSSAILPFAETDGIDTVLAGEVLEHLANPGWLLQRVAQSFPCAALLITTPNAFSKSGQRWMARGIENVNIEHTFWPSWHTLKALVGRYGYKVSEWYWYGGEPLTAEGLVFVCRQSMEAEATDAVTQKISCVHDECRPG